MLYAFIYLLSIVSANLLIAELGAPYAPLIGFLFIGLDLTSRDKIHDVWIGKGLVWKMGLLIAVGSVLSWLLNRNAGIVALASFTAFACAAVADTIVYQILHKQTYPIKVNGSNILSALVDSLVFPTIAFGGIMPWIMLGQFVAKVGGGFMWSLFLGKGDFGKQ